MAGPFGYSLHRMLKMGATNYVVRPRDWDEYGQKVKTDKRDAKQLALHLDRYVSGTTTRSAWCGCPAPNRSKGAASPDKGRVSSTNGSAWPPRDAAMPFITA